MKNLSFVVLFFWFLSSCTSESSEEMIHNNNEACALGDIGFPSISEGAEHNRLVNRLLAKVLTFADEQV